jgi:hypothetical protein
MSDCKKCGGVLGHGRTCEHFTPDMALPKDASVPQQGESIDTPEFWCCVLKWYDADQPADEKAARAALIAHIDAKLAAARTAAPAQDVAPCKREAFEAWYLAEMDAHANFARDPDFSEFYDDLDVQRSWRGYQAHAALAAQAGNVAVPDGGGWMETQEEACWLAFCDQFDGRKLTGDMREALDFGMKWWRSNTTAQPATGNVAVPDGVYDNKATMRREGWVGDRLAWSQAAALVMQLIPGADEKPAPFGTYPDVPTAQPPASTSEEGRDAARYRFLRDNPLPNDRWALAYGRELDETIDAAMHPAATDAAADGAKP